LDQAMMNPPASVGRLGERSLPNLLAYAFATRHDGELRLSEHAGAEHAVLLHRGGIVGLRTARAPGAPRAIGRLLVEAGALTEEAFARTSRALGSDDLALGEQLVASGLVPAAALLQARGDQIAAGVDDLVATLYESTTFSLVHGTAPRTGLPPIDPVPIVFAGTLARGLDTATRTGVTALGDGPLALAAAAQIDRLRASGGDALALTALDGGRAATIAEVARRGALDAERARRVIGALLLLGWIGAAAY
jgi:hypothetical protein